MFYSKTFCNLATRISSTLKIEQFIKLFFMQKHLFAIKVNTHLSVIYTIKYNKNVMVFQNCWNIICCT